jgi:hypothetical protein
VQLTPQSSHRVNGPFFKDVFKGWHLVLMQVEMSAYLKHTVGVNQLVSGGGQGFRAQGQYDPSASLSGTYAWMNAGGAGGYQLAHS